MATPNEPLGSSISDIEARDIVSAIAASLDTAQVGPRHVYDSGNWEPMTSEQHKTQRRQMEALDEVDKLREFPGYNQAVQASLEDSRRRMSSAEAGREAPGKINHSLAPQHDPWKLVERTGSAKALTPIQGGDLEDKKDLTLVQKQLDSSREEPAPSYAALPATNK